MKIHKKIDTFLLFFLGTLWLLSLGPNVQAKTKTIKNKTIEKLFRISGLNTHYKEVETILERYKSIDPKYLKPSQAGFAKNLMRNQKGPKLVLENLKKTFLIGFNQGHAEASIAWFKSQTGQKILKAKIADNSSYSNNERKNFIKQVLSVPSNKSRLLIIERIVSEETMAENVQSLFLAYVESMFPFNYNLKGKKLFKATKTLQRKKSEFFREKVRLERLFDFRDLKEEDLKSYARFLKSPAGKWFTFSESKGFKKGTKITLAKIREIQRKLSLEIENGGPGFPLMRELAPAGQRYLLVRPRDSFKPLFTDKGLVQTRKPKAVSGFRKFGGELEDTPLISLYVMNKIKGNRPELFKKLKYYELLFNSREDLKAMNDHEYADTVEAYRKVLGQASQTKVSKTPLQTEYKKLRLTGTISKNQKILALVETSDQKGYVVDKGKLIGPMFGFVDEVQPERIIVIEKSRNYLGNILTKQRTLEFSKNI